MQYSYYPGCSLEASAYSYDASLKSIFHLFGLEQKEIKDWNCCGATAYMSVKEMVSLAISARNLALAEKNGQDIVAPCSACYTVLAKTHKILSEKAELHEHVNTALAEAGMFTTATSRLASGGLPIPKVLLTSSDVQNGKPDPHGYRLAAERLGALPANCVVIEDTPAGISAAKAAGMKVIAVMTTHAASELTEADVRVSQLSELTILLRNKL